MTTLNDRIILLYLKHAFFKKNKTFIQGIEVRDTNGDLISKREMINSIYRSMEHHMGNIFVVIGDGKQRDEFA